MLAKIPLSPREIRNESKVIEGCYYQKIFKALQPTQASTFF